MFRNEKSSDRFLRLIPQLIPHLVPVLILSSLALVGCAKSGGSGSRHEKKTELEGSVVEALNQLYASDRLESCDVRFKEQQFAIARDLDARRDQIEAYAKAHPVTGYRNLPLNNGFFFRARIEPLPQQPDRWSTDTYGWDDLISFYEKIKSRPFGEEWFRLNSATRSIIPNDLDRVLYFSDSYIAHDSRNTFLELKAASEGLKASSQPLLPESLLLTDSQKYLVSRNVALNKIYSLFMDPSTTPDRRRELVGHFLDWINAALANFEFRKNSSVTSERRGGETVFAVPLWSDAFDAEGKAQIKSIVEKAWVGPGTRVEVRWMSSAVENVFKALIGDEIYGRSFVNFKKQILVLQPGVQVTAVAHEVGHVMGFPDEYYTLWNPSACEYTDEYNSGNLMSDSGVGVVLPKHWDELGKNYSN